MLQNTHFVWDRAEWVFPRKRKLVPCHERLNPCMAVCMYNCSVFELAPINIGPGALFWLALGVVIQDNALYGTCYISRYLPGMMVVCACDIRSRVAEFSCNFGK